MMLRFHRNTGYNIILEEQGKVAQNVRSWYDAVVFSNRPLMVDETFLFEIQDNEPKFAYQTLRCGVTLHNPKNGDLPQCLEPTLMEFRKSWVFIINKSVEQPFGKYTFHPNPRSVHARVEKCKESNISKLSPALLKSKTAGCTSTGPGSRIALHLTKEGSLYFVINGIQYGPSVENIPVGNNGVFVVMDLHQTTQKIKIINAHGRLASII